MHNQSEIEKIKDYLQKRYTPSTAERYQRDIIHYLESMPKAKTASYKQVLGYLGELRKKYSNPDTIHRILQGVKKYYYYLNHTGQREDHPCRYLNLKDSRKKAVQLQDLFTSEELEKLLAAKERKCTRRRNKSILSLLIYQGLTRKEVVTLKASDVNFTEGVINIKASNTINARALPLKSKQVGLLYEYLYKERQTLLKGKEQSQLFIGQTGGALKEDAITRLVQTYGYLFKEKHLTTKSIRMSVTRNLLKSGKDFRVVQAFMGHKNPTSTERYKEEQGELLKNAIQKYHPLG